MSHYFKIFIAVFAAIIGANLVISTLFSFWYKSETDLAIEKSQKQIEMHQQANENRVKAIQEQQQQKYALMSESMKLKQQETMRKLELDSWERDIQRKAYDEQREKLKAQRKIEYQKEREKRQLLREKQRIQNKNKLADQEHIRRENQKTCQFWIEQYQENPTAKNKSMRQSSCERANRYY